MHRTPACQFAIDIPNNGTISCTGCQTATAAWEGAKLRGGSWKYHGNWHPNTAGTSTFKTPQVICFRWTFRENLVEFCAYVISICCDAILLHCACSHGIMMSRFWVEKGGRTHRKHKSWFCSAIKALAQVHTIQLRKHRCFSGASYPPFSTQNLDVALLYFWPFVDACLLPVRCDGMRWLFVLCRYVRTIMWGIILAVVLGFANANATIMQVYVLQI